MLYCSIVMFSLEMYRLYFSTPLKYQCLSFHPLIDNALSGESVANIALSLNQKQWCKILKLRILETSYLG